MLPDKMLLIIQRAPSLSGLSARDVSKRRSALYRNKCTENNIRLMEPENLYLDYAATTPPLPAARDAMAQGFSAWANPSSPHKAGRAARSALEIARKRIMAVLGWEGEIIFTSGASESIQIAITQGSQGLGATSPVEHDSVLRCAAGAARLRVDGQGQVDPDSIGAPGLIAIQHVNSETGVIQPLDTIAKRIHASGGLLLADCAQSAGKLDLPDADLIAIAAHKFGGPVGVGALLVRDWKMLHPSGGQERGYRGGTENLPGVLAMAAALEEGNGWLGRAASLRQTLDEAIVEAGGGIIAADARRIASIASYRMPGVESAVQLIRFDAMGIAVSAGSACSSGSLKSSHVLMAMGLDQKIASEVIRVSIGRETTADDIQRFLTGWQDIAQICGAA